MTCSPDNVAVLRKVKLIHGDFFSLLIFPTAVSSCCQISENGKNSENLTHPGAVEVCRAQGCRRQQPLSVCVPGVCSHCSSALCMGTLLRLWMCPNVFWALISSQLTKWTSSPSNNYLWVMGFASSPLRSFVSSSYRRIW